MIECTLCSPQISVEWMSTSRCVRSLGLWFRRKIRSQLSALNSDFFAVNIAMDSRRFSFSSHMRSLVVDYLSGNLRKNLRIFSSYLKFSSAYIHCLSRMLTWSINWVIVSPGHIERIQYSVSSPSTVASPDTAYLFSSSFQISTVFCVSLVDPKK